MSTPLGLAAVTAVLRDVLEGGMKARKVGDIVNGDVTVSTLSPDRIKIGDSEKTGLNLFLYHVTPNPGWRNRDLPTRDARGDRIANPALALDLHYLVTAYGEDSFHAEIVLGNAMHLLHELAVVPRAMIRKALAPTSPPQDLPAALKTSELADQVEQVKITPESMTIDEMSKIWGALNANYRPTAAYAVSVVLIEGRKSASAALPVLARGVAAIELRQPTIEAVESNLGPNQPITSTSTILIRGIALAGDDATLHIAGVDATAAIASANAVEMVVPLAGVVGLRAGIQPVQLTHRVPLGDPPEAHTIFESNVAAFVLRPAITPAVLSSTNLIENGVTYKQGEIQLTFVPRVGAQQRVTLLLNQFNTPAGATPRAYSFAAATGNGVVAPATDTDKIKVPFKRVLPGEYLVRARVDGAESLLLTDVNGTFHQPRVTL